MRSSLANKVKVYNLTAGKSLPEWLEERKKNRKSAGDSRIELIHDLDFPHFARCLFRSENGTFIFAAGDYPPRIKCFDVNDLSQKFSFNADMPICGGVSLSPDFRKFALRSDGRVITVHNTAHVVDRIRVPHTQRCLEFHEGEAELVSGGNSHEVFRINLETGCFMESYKTNSDDGVNCATYFKKHGLMLAGCENGVVECFDPRCSSSNGASGESPATLPIASLDIRSIGSMHGVEDDAAVTSLAVDDHSGLHVAVGTSSGQVLLFDLRMRQPLLVKDHFNSLPIVRTRFYEGTVGSNTHVISADTRAVKVWNKGDGSNFTTMEAPADIYDLTVVRGEHNMASPYKCADSGVILLACDTPRVQVHFVPQLGMAPKWAPFLDMLTGELEEKEENVVYDDYRFVTAEDAQSLSISADALVEGKVRPAMHGCYVEARFYRELKAIADPTAYNQNLKEARLAKRQARTDDRISKFKRLDDGKDKINPDDEQAVKAKELLSQLPESAKPFLKDMTPEALALIAKDSRFSGKVGKGQFNFDQKNPEFMRLFQRIDQHQTRATERRQKYEEEHFHVVKAQDDDASDNGGGETQDFEDEGIKMLRNQVGKKRARASKDDSAPALKKAPAGKTTMMMEGKEGVDVLKTDQATHAARKVDRLKGKTLAERMKAMSKLKEKKM